MPQKAPVKSYAQLKAALDEVLDKLQSTELDVDEALKQYQQGLELVKQIETYLDTVGNSVVELKAKFNAKTSK